MVVAFAPKATFTQSDFDAALQKRGEYVCMLNFTWVDWKFTTAPGVPILKSMVTDFAETFYPSGGPLEQIKLTVAVDGSTSPANQRGALKAVTPQEEILAPYWALGALLHDKKISDSDAEMWKRLFLTTQVTFKLLKGDEDREFETMLIRQAGHHRFQAIVYTPVQWVCKIVQMKQDHQGKVSAADIAKLFKKHNFKAAQGQEEITATFVTNACYIWDHALCYSEVHDVLICGAERFTS